MTTACAVDSWDHALRLSAARWGGVMTADALLAPAQTLAKEGFLPGASQQFWLDFRRADWPDWPGFSPLLGAPTGELLRQPQLAHVLALLRQDGLRSFYDGPMARWPDGPMARWPDGPMARWPDGPMARWPDGPMARWPDG
ncbi:gamma-glutamyltransferase, partial [Paracoccus nototheniae]|uniref:gamma-glutamyltransferase n=1 Tax=Paracoccus nototheniae TaxID=2489002 RepID=UPI001F604916